VARWSSSLASVFLCTLIGAPVTAAEEDVFSTTAKPSFRKLAPEPGTDREYYYAEDVQPDIEIRRESNAEYQDYSVNGNTYMVKVNPKHGRPYYLMDSDGNGDFSWRRGNMNTELLVPGWAIASW